MLSCVAFNLIELLVVVAFLAIAVSSALRACICSIGHPGSAYDLSRLDDLKRPIFYPGRKRATRWGSAYQHGCSLARQCVRE